MNKNPRRSREALIIMSQAFFVMAFLFVVMALITTQVNDPFPPPSWYLLMALAMVFTGGFILAVKSTTK